MYDIVDGITDAGLTHLIGMKSLTQLERKSRPDLTDAAITAFQKTRPDVTVSR
jgi:hypothetical protein